MNRIGGWLAGETGGSSAEALWRMAGLSGDEWGEGVVIDGFGGFVTGRRTELRLPLVRREGSILLLCGEGEGGFAELCYDRSRRRVTLFRSEDGAVPLYITRQGRVWWFATDPRALPGDHPVRPVPKGKRVIVG